MKISLSEDVYLRTSFPGVDPEFRDGELVERGLPDYLHSKTQANILLMRRNDGLPYFALPSLRHRARPGRYLIPDVAVHWPNRPLDDVPADPSLIAIEILSDDRMVDVRAKLQEYRDWGVRHVWLIDPRQRSLSIYDHDGLRDVPHFDVPESDRKLTPADLFD